jgi:cob(I)alamin adenosyltransferase
MLRIARENTGNIYIIYGSGKGKTTFSIGFMLQNLGSGKRAAMVQFMKGYGYSESSILASISQVSFFQTGTPFFVKKGYPSKVDINEARRGLSIAEYLLSDPAYGVVVLDEINVAADYGLLAPDEILAVVAKKQPGITVVLTGRNPPSPFFKIATLSLEMQEIKHPFKKGVLSRKGIDY